MLETKQVEALVKNVEVECQKWLTEVSNLGNQCAYTDRIIENIIARAKELEAKYEKQWTESEEN